MDLKQAFYKQKEELNQLKRDYAKLEKKLIKVIKENAADERVQEYIDFANLECIKERT